MQIWIPQSVFPSRTTRTLARTRYLAGVRGALVRAIERYHASEPGGEEVTLACLEAVGEAGVHDLARTHGRTYDTVKQDLGLFVAILLAETYPPEQVETYRDETTRKNAVRVRPSRRGGLDWVSKYTPHRLARAAGATAARARRRANMPVAMLAREDDGADLRYWLSRPPAERLDAMETLREQHYALACGGVLPRIGREVRLVDRVA